MGDSSRIGETIKNKSEGKRLHLSDHFLNTHYVSVPVTGPRIQEMTDTVLLYSGELGMCGGEEHSRGWALVKRLKKRRNLGKASLTTAWI